MLDHLFKIYLLQLSLESGISCFQACYKHFQIIAPMSKPQDTKGPFILPLHCSAVLQCRRQQYPLHVYAVRSLFSHFTALYCSSVLHHIAVYCSILQCNAVTKWRPMSTIDPAIVAMNTAIVFYFYHVKLRQIMILTYNES